MHNKSALLTAAVIAVGAISLGGCATKDFVNQQVSAEDAKVQTNQTRTDQHLAKLDQDTQDALNRATEAGKLAQGKFLYSMVLSDDSIKFKADSAKLSPEAQQRLQAFAEQLKTDNRNVYLEIQGHTDSTGSDAVNQKLGEERAEAVRLFLNEQGVPLNRMNTISYGEKDPANAGKNRAARAQNRRVVLVVMA